MTKITRSLSMMKMIRSQQQPMFKFRFDLEILLIKSKEMQK